MKNKTFKILSDYRTIIMGIAMISIILFHYTEDCFYQVELYKGVTKIYKELVGSVGVDIFLLMSGLGMYYSLSKSDKIVEFYKKRLVKIIIPYLIIAIPTLIWTCIKTNLDITYFLKEILFINLINGESKLYWYIIFILFCYVISPIIYEHIKTTKNRQDIANKIMVLCIGNTLLNLLLLRYSPTIFENFNIMILRLTPFFIGFYLGYLSYKKEKIKFTDILLLIIGLAFIKLANNPNHIIERYSKFFGITSLMLLFLIFISKFDKNKIVQFIFKIIEFFGKYSLEIYLIHVSARKLLNHYGLYTYQIKYFICYILIAVILAPLVNKLAKLIENKIINIGKRTQLKEG